MADRASGFISSCSSWDCIQFGSFAVANEYGVRLERVGLTRAVVGVTARLRIRGGGASSLPLIRARTPIGASSPRPFREAPRTNRFLHSDRSLGHRARPSRRRRRGSACSPLLEPPRRVGSLRGTRSSGSGRRSRLSRAGRFLGVAEGGSRRRASRRVAATTPAAFRMVGKNPC